MRAHRTKLLAGAVALVLTACGSGDSSDTTTAGGWDDEYTEATTASDDGWSTETTAAAYPDVEFEGDEPAEPEITDVDELSTFALDVDTAAYTIGRTYLVDGNLPDPESVRVEEYVNFFAQDYPVPERGFSITVDGGPTPFVDEYTRVLRIGLRAEDLESRPDTNLVFVIDTSGSMEEGGRLEIVKHSLEMLVDQLRPDDTVTIVEFGSEASLVLGPTWGEDKGEISDAIRTLRPIGATNFEDGLRLGYDAADQLHESGGSTRVIVASDGVANRGLTDESGLVEMIRRDADRGITLVTVGVGMGNYNDVLLETLADDGDGFYAYVDTQDEAEDLFVRDLTGTLVTVAEDARVQVAFDPDTVARWRLVGYENRAIADDQFRDDSVDAGEIGAGHTVTALYEIELTDAAIDGREDRIGDVAARWLDPATDEPTERSRTVYVDELARHYRDTVPRFQQDIVVAQFAEVLRHSGHAGAWNVSELVPYADDVADMLPRDDKVQEFAELVRMAARLET